MAKKNDPEGKRPASEPKGGPIEAARAEIRRRFDKEALPGEDLQQFIARIYKASSMERADQPAKRRQITNAPPPIKTVSGGGHVPRRRKTPPLPEDIVAVRNTLKVLIEEAIKEIASRCWDGDKDKAEQELVSRLLASGEITAYDSGHREVRASRWRDDPNCFRREDLFLFRSHLQQLYGHRLWPASAGSEPDSAAAPIVQDDVVASSVAAKHRGGRPSPYNQDAFKKEIVRLANTPDGLPDRAALFSHMADWCAENWGDNIPADSTIRNWIAKVYPTNEN